MCMKIRIVLLLLGLSTFILGNAQNDRSLKGSIQDAESKEPIVGALIYLSDDSENKKPLGESGLDGSFVLRKIPTGNIKIRVSYLGYKEQLVEVNIDASEILATPIGLYKNSLNEVIVIGHKNGDDRKSFLIDRNADGLQNSLSARAIEISPDVTVANSLQRMSGVTIQRSSNGEGRYAIIRGMDQRYNTTLINGIKIPSPDDKYRYVPMDLFPSDLLERLEVIKTLTPDKEGDAVGGIMNLVMKNAPNYQIVSGFFSAGSSTLFSDRPFQTFNSNVINKRSPAQINGPSYLAKVGDFPRRNLILRNASQPSIQAGATYGNRFFDKKLGFVLGLSFQNNYRGSDQILNTQYPGATILPSSAAGKITDNYPQFDATVNNKYSTQNRRIAVNNKFDYNINNKNKISLYNLYVRMDEFQARSSSDTDVNTNLGQVKINTRTRWQIQTIYNSTLHGDHNLSDRLSFNWTAAYSVARQQTPDYANFEVDYAKTKNADGTQSLPLIFTPNSPSMSAIWAHNSDKDLSGYLNFIYKTKLSNNDLEISWGGLARHKIRDNYYIKYSLTALDSSFSDILSSNLDFKTGSATAPYGNTGIGRNYSIKENVVAGYGQFKLDLLQKLQIIGGVRIENTSQRYNTNLSSDVNAGKGHIYYTDVLPSLHLKYAFDDRQNLRASYFRSLVRPGFVEIIPQDIPASENEAYEQQGNPYLKHTTADNYDFRYELYPKGTDQVLIGAFFKRLYNPVEVTFSHYSVIGGNPSPGTNILTPTNIGNVKNFGIEAVYTKFFGKFGINANYTYTHSSATTSKYFLHYDSTTKVNVTQSRNQTRPLQGQAKHIGNLSFIYKNPSIGLDAQIAYVYTGERIALVNTFYDMDTWQAPYSQLDFSFEKKLFKRLSLYGKINNLLDTKTKYYIKQPYLIGNTLNKIPGQSDPTKQIFVQQDIYKISYLFGIRFKL
ncbi:MAG: TonB-dependent receptor [Pseudopedobacter saltans]|uniref:TonB-dependent receptor n=1 Tax=Pseudopedobacter saltans TaxID=151895 RepID=A0A2W5HG27_9SPHI|nr:MAG: TonB-dependent receptor [Pseudopedobacter saltans]